MEKTRRIQTVRLSAILLVTLFLVSIATIAMPMASASTEVALEASDDSIAEWTDDEQYSGDFSVMLSLPDGAAEDSYAEVSIPAEVMLAALDLHTTFFWCNSTVGDWTPYFIFETNATSPYDRINTDAYSSAGFVNWARYNASNTPQFQLSNGTWTSWGNITAAVGSSKVTRVYVELSGLKNPGETDYGPFTAYVDDITINNVTYELEPEVGESMVAIDAYIQSLPDDAFKNSAENRKATLQNKLQAVENQIEQGAFKGAEQKLLNDIRSKMDGSMGGKANNDWIINPEAQQHLCALIDSILADLRGSDGSNNTKGISGNSSGGSDAESGSGHSSQGGKGQGSHGDNGHGNGGNRGGKGK